MILMTKREPITSDQSGDRVTDGHDFRADRLDRYRLLVVASGRIVPFNEKDRGAPNQNGRSH